ncbi:hypothetical protein A6R68_00300, partial [Neotoma lepida]
QLPTRRKYFRPHQRWRRGRGGAGRRKRPADHWLSTMAAATASPALKRLDLRDPNALFETHGAEEIRGLERQVRAEIEHKKEELRQMVGERYRDLIEAADTIGQMRRCAEGLVDAVRATDQYCARLRQAGSAAPRVPRAPQPQQPSEKFYSMAAHIKLLLEIPEKIWSSMETSQHLQATQLYLLCCHLHSLLQLDSSSSRYSPILSRFPILIRQVAAASHFRSTILHESKMLLQCQNVSDQAVAEALCSIMLLEESSPRQALTDFLMARKATIQKLLNQPHHGGKGHRCPAGGDEALQLVQTPAGLHYGVPARATNSRTSYQPGVPERHTTEMDRHVSNQKASLRLDLHTAFDVATLTLTREGFESISNSSKELLVSALQELETNNSTSNKHVHFEQNMSLFLWSESPSDLPPDAAWVSVANRAQFANSGLSMKAQAVSPCVQNFCSALDSKLKVKLDDLLAYLPSSDTPLPKDPSPMHQAKNSAFDRYADAGTVQDMLRTQSVACIKYVVGCIQAELQTIEEVTQDQKDVLHSTKLHAVLFMARLCQSLGELCPHLKQCIVGKCGGSEKPAREARALKKQGKGKAQEVLPAQAQWQEVKEVLLQQSIMAYRVWSSALVKFLISGFMQSLLLSDAGSILATATNWDELEIQEETESGSSVTSKIRLPTQPSWYVQSFLFGLCQEVNRVGGHALPKVTLQEMLKTCMTQVIAAYEQLTEGQQLLLEGLTPSPASLHLQKEGTFAMTQNRALQLLYDLRYLNIVLTSKGEERIMFLTLLRIEKVTDRLEALIDPFDLDVFTPHLNSNLNRLVQRTSVLFGLVTGTENQFASRSSTFNSQEPHNILPLASSQIRFGLLPLSMTSTRKAKATSRGIETAAQVGAKRRGSPGSSNPLPNSAPKPPPALLEITN